MELFKTSGRFLIVYAIWLGFISLVGVSLDIKLIMDRGMGTQALLLALPLSFVVPILLLFLLRETETRLLITLSTILRGLGFLVLGVFSGLPATLFYIVAAVGAPIAIFWVPANRLYFKKREEQSNAFISSIYAGFPVVLGVVMPLIGGAFGSSFGLADLCILIGILYLLASPVVWLLVPRERMGVNIEKEYNNLRGFKTLILLEGVFGSSLFIALPLLSLVYFQTPAEIGGFSSFTALAAVFASVAVSKLSDKRQERNGYIWLFAPAVFVSVMLGLFTKDAISWSMAMALFAVTRTLFYPFTLTILMDNVKKAEETMVAREIILNAGRIIGAGLIFVVYYLTGSLAYSLAASAGTIVFYPLFMRKKMGEGKMVVK